MLHAAATWQETSGRPPTIKPIRELMWFVWEQPRLPRPVHRGKYPLSVPWTPAARRAYEEPGAPVSIEHVIPAAVLVRRLLQDPPGTTEALMDFLDEIEYVVIAPEDNRLLNAAGVGSKFAPSSKDPWDCYRAAGLDPSTFVPVKIRN